MAQGQGFTDQDMDRIMDKHIDMMSRPSRDPEFDQEAVEQLSMFAKIRKDLKDSKEMRRQQEQNAKDNETKQSLFQAIGGGL